MSYVAGDRVRLRRMDGEHPSLPMVGGEVIEAAEQGKIDKWGEPYVRVLWDGSSKPEWCSPRIIEIESAPDALSRIVRGWPEGRTPE